MGIILHVIDYEVLEILKRGQAGMVPLPVDGRDRPHLKYSEVLHGRMMRPG